MQRRRGDHPRTVRSLLSVLVVLALTVVAGVTSAGAGSAATTTTLVAADSFSRTARSGWGSATTGGAWTVSTPSYFSVDGSRGAVSVRAGWTLTASLDQVTSTSVDVQASFGLSALPSTSTQFVSLLARRVGSGDYRVMAKVASTGAAQLTVQASGVTLRSTTLTGYTYAPGDRLTLRMQATGTNPTTLAAKAWKTGTAEPAGWLLTTTDSTAALQVGGSPGMQTYLSSAVTNGPIQLTMDDLRAATVTPVGADQPPVASFTSSADLLVASFDGTGSTDPDGSVVGWSWDFGDGGVAASATASHTFRASGTYPVRLTVTDDRGATATTSSPVTVIDPARPSKDQWLADVATALTGASGVVDVGAARSRPALVLDIDNTALESYYAPFAATPPVLALARRAAAEGYAVLFATGRPPTDRPGTVSQLTGAGYPIGDLCMRDPTVSVQDSKIACRAAWTAQGYTIVADVGNHQTDLAGPNAGTTYLLPNYGYLA